MIIPSSITNHIAIAKSLKVTTVRYFSKLCSPTTKKPLNCAFWSIFEVCPASTFNSSVRSMKSLSLLIKSFFFCLNSQRHGSQLTSHGPLKKKRPASMFLSSSATFSTFTAACIQSSSHYDARNVIIYSHKLAFNVDHSTQTVDARASLQAHKCNMLLLFLPSGAFWEQKTSTFTQTTFIIFPVSNGLDAWGHWGETPTSFLTSDKEQLTVTTEFFFPLSVCISLNR